MLLPEVVGREPTHRLDEEILPSGDDAAEDYTRMIEFLSHLDLNHLPPEHALPDDLRRDMPVETVERRARIGEPVVAALVVAVTDLG
jgi:hypothetical protein